MGIFSRTLRCDKTAALRHPHCGLLCCDTFLTWVWQKILQRKGGVEDLWDVAFFHGCRRCWLKNVPGLLINPNQNIVFSLGYCRPWCGLPWPVSKVHRDLCKVLALAFAQTASRFVEIGRVGCSARSRGCTENRSWINRSWRVCSLLPTFQYFPVLIIFNQSIVNPYLLLRPCLAKTNYFIV